MASLINPGGDALAAVARMHWTELPGSLISKLGRRYTAAFYGFVATSALEFVFARTDDEGTVLGGGFVSLSPAGLTSRIVRNTPLLRALVARPGVCARLMWGNIRSHGRTPDMNPENDPELVALFVRPDRRSHGIGALLLLDIEQVLRSQNRKRYVLRTVDRTENRAIKFYESAGFVTLTRESLHGENFRFMAKEL